MRSRLSVAHLPAWTEPAPSSASSKPDFTRLLPPKLQHCAMAGRGGAARTNGTAASNKICQFKLVLLGESAVGKSSLVLRFVKGQFHEYQESTIGGECVIIFISRSVSALCCVLMSSQLLGWGILIKSVCETYSFHPSYHVAVHNVSFSSSWSIYVLASTEKPLACWLKSIFVVGACVWRVAEPVLDCWLPDSPMNHQDSHTLRRYIWILWKEIRLIN